MKSFAIALLVIGAVLAVTPASAQDEGQTSFTLIAENPEFVWKDEAGTVNPTLVVPSGASITVTVRNDPDADGFHAFAIKGGDQSSDIDTAGQETTFTFTAPESGSVEYNCPYHAGTMTGTVQVAGSEAPEVKNESPGVALVGTLVALVGVALLARR